VAGRADATRRSQGWSTIAPESRPARRNAPGRIDEAESPVSRILSDCSVVII
jgi:hypothetical protein